MLAITPLAAALCQLPGSSLSFQTSDGQRWEWSQQKEGLGGQQSFVALKTQLLSVILQGVGQEYSFYGGRRAHLLRYKNTCAC